MPWDAIALHTFVMNDINIRFFFLLSLSHFIWNLNVPFLQTIISTMNRLCVWAMLCCAVMWCAEREESHRLIGCERPINQATRLLKHTTFYWHTVNRRLGWIFRYIWPYWTELSGKSTRMHTKFSIQNNNNRQTKKNRIKYVDAHWQMHSAAVKKEVQEQKKKRDVMHLITWKCSSEASWIQRKAAYTKSLLECLLSLFLNGFIGCLPSSLLLLFLLSSFHRVACWNPLTFRRKREKKVLGE